MSKVLRTIGVIAGTVAVVAASFGAVGVAAIAGAVAAPPSSPECLGFKQRNEPVTLMNGLIHDGTGYLWTDTAMFEASTGKRMEGEISKGFVGTLWPWAAVLSGTVETASPYRIPTMISAKWPSNPNELMQAAATALRTEADRGFPARLLISHACNQMGARMYLICADDVGFVKPFEPFEVTEFLSSGRGVEAADNFLAEDLTPVRMREFINLQAQIPTKSTLGWEGVTIGGNVVEMQVSPRGLATPQPWALAA